MSVLSSLTQDLGALVGPLGEGPVRREVVPSQADEQLTPERLVVPARDQPAALKRQRPPAEHHRHTK